MYQVARETSAPRRGRLRDAAAVAAHVDHVSCSFSATSPALSRPRLLLPVGCLVATAPFAPWRLRGRLPQRAEGRLPQRPSYPTETRRGPSAGLGLAGGPQQGALSGSRLGGGYEGRLERRRPCSLAWAHACAVRVRHQGDCRAPYLSSRTPVQYASESSSESAPPEAGPHRRPIESAPPPAPQPGRRPEPPTAGPQHHEQMRTREWSGLSRNRLGPRNASPERAPAQPAPGLARVRVAPCVPGGSRGTMKRQGHDKRMASSARLVAWRLAGRGGHET